MTFDLDVAHEIVKEMRATDWLKYEGQLPSPKGLGL